MSTLCQPGVQAGKAGFDVQFGQIRNAMDAEGMGIILWDTFFSNVIPYLRACRVCLGPVLPTVLLLLLCACSHLSAGFVSC